MRTVVHPAERLLVQVNLDEQAGVRQPDPSRAADLRVSRLGFVRFEHARRFFSAVLELIQQLSTRNCQQ